MTNQTSAARAHIGSLLLCLVVLSGLAACGTEGAASAARAAGSDNTLVSPSVGMINRTPTTPSSPTTTTPPTASNPGKGTSGTATLDWTPPTQNSDGTALTNLAGYTVYYGTSPNQLTQSVKVANPGMTAYTLNNLASGTWYFTVTSYTSTGVESQPTGVVSTTI